MIRAAQIRDILDIIQLIHASIRSCSLDHQQHETRIQLYLEDITQEKLLLWMHYNDSWVYVVNGQILGFILINDYGKILLHYVSPETQQLGIGKSLLFHIIKQAQQQQRQQISVDSTQTALAFYQKHGFKIHQPMSEKPAPLRLIHSLMFEAQYSLT